MRWLKLLFYYLTLKKYHFSRILGFAKMAGIAIIISVALNPFSIECDARPVRIRFLMQETQRMQENYAGNVRSERRKRRNSQNARMKAVSFSCCVEVLGKLKTCKLLYFCYNVDC